MPHRQDGPSLDPTSSQSARASAPDSTETRQVLMQRVIALNGVPETAAATKPKPAKVELATDLTRTVHEWGVHPPNSGASAAPPLPSVHSQPAHNIKASADPQCATHSSIALEVYEEAQLPPRILNANIEDAVTQQYNPATTRNPITVGRSIADLANLDRALESAGVLDDHEFGVITNYQPTTTPARSPAVLAAPPVAQPAPQPPGMLLVPVSIVWTVLTIFSLCTLALTGLIIAIALRGGLF